MKQSFTVRQAALEGVEAFPSIAQHHSFRRPAAEFAVTPSAISQPMRAREARVRAVLFIGTTRRVGLTEAGERFVRVPSLRGASSPQARSPDLAAQQSLAHRQQNPQNSLETINAVCSCADSRTWKLHKLAKPNLRRIRDSKPAPAAAILPEPLIASLC
jgi:Bacterial regulatory helix-turn-helix protein, lysR family